jgi:phage terminase large subunit-like protein
VLPDATGFDVISQCFMPGDRIPERVRRDRVPYDQWRKQGILTVTDGPTTDYEAVRAAVKAWALRYDLQVVAYDPWNATDLITRLEKQDGIVCVPMRQGFASLSAPTKSLEQTILAKRLRHDGDPILRWCVSNVAVEQDAAGNLKPSKAVSTEKIDAVVAMIMAVDVMDRNANTPIPDYQMRVFG